MFCLCSFHKEVISIPLDKLYCVVLIARFTTNNSTLMTILIQSYSFFKFNKNPVDRLCKSLWFLDIYFVIENETISAFPNVQYHGNDKKDDPAPTARSRYIVYIWDRAAGAFS